MYGSLEKISYFFSILSLIFFFYCSVDFVMENFGENELTRNVMLLVVGILWANAISLLVYFKRLVVSNESRAA